MNNPNYSTRAPFTTINQPNLPMASFETAFNDPLTSNRRSFPNTTYMRDKLDRMNYYQYIQGMEPRTDELTHYCKYCDFKTEKQQQPDIHQFLDNVPQCNSCKKYPTPLRPDYSDEIFDRR